MQRFNWRKFLLDLVSSAVVLLLIEAALNIRGLPVSPLSFPYLIVASSLIALAVQIVSWKGSAIGGWLYPVIVLGGVYLSIIGIHSLNFQDIYPTFIHKFQLNYEVAKINTERFKEAYIILASASFTLIGLFFIVLRIKDFSPLNASRLISIGEAFAVVFLLSVSALIFRDEIWWRWLLIVGLNGTALLVLLKSPEPYVIDFAHDPSVVVFYWERWDDSRRGWSVLAALGLLLMPVAPVVGESIFFLSLLYLLYLAAHAAVFLYASTEIKVPDVDQTLRGLFRITIPKKKLYQIEAWKAPFRGIGVSLVGVEQVPFVPFQPPQQQQPRQRQ